MENHPDAREYERNNGLVGYEELVSRYMGGIWYLVFEWTGFWGGVISGVLPMLRGNLTPNSRLQEFQPVVRWRGRWSSCGSGEHTHTFCVDGIWYLVFEWAGFWGVSRLVSSQCCEAT